jgi:cytochrome P450
MDDTTNTPSIDTIKARPEEVAARHCPVTHDPATALEHRNWATDFDHADPVYNANASVIWDDLRGRCPVAHSEAYGGTWLPVRGDDVKAIAYDTDNFSSVSVVVSNNNPLKEEDGDNRPIGGAPPITSDPPFHQIARRLLLPAFSPKAIDPWEPEVRKLCVALLDRLEGRDVIDAAADYAAHIPVRVIATMLGLPLEDEELFRTFVFDVLEDVDAAPEVRQAKFQALGEYLRQHVEAHREDPRDDLISFLLGVRLGDEPLSIEHVVGTIILLLVAGIDTTWSAIGSSIKHLAEHPEDLARMVADPQLVPTAVEELLRAYAPVTMARVVANDTEIGGCPVSKGDWVLLPFPAANLDPDWFEDANEVRIDRAENRHAAFGLGIHRCLGSNLARLELRVALEEFIRRYPTFTLADPDQVVWSLGQVRGPRALDVRVA